jgi:hypothetical protein
MKTLGHMHARTLTAAEVAVVGGGNIRISSVSITLSLTGPDIGVAIDLD